MWFPTTFNTMGIVTDAEHPIFNNFPTESHSNWQWWNLVKNSRPIILDDTDQSYRPIMQAIDNFGNDKSVDGAVNNRKLGLIFEGTVGNGKVLVCSIDLLEANKNRPEAKQLYNSIIQYMASDEFQPDYEFSGEWLQEKILKANMADGIAVNKSGEGYPRPFASYSLGGETRLWNIIDGNIDITIPDEAWTNWNAEYDTGDYIGVEFDGNIQTGQINLYVFEDHGCKAPATWELQYWKDGEWLPVENAVLQDKEVMEAGKNTIIFDPVVTSQLRIFMTMQEEMYLAITEFDVQGTEVSTPPTAIHVAAENGQNSVRAGESLSFTLTYEPEDAEDTAVVWSVEDEDGNTSELAEISEDGVLTAKAVGKIVVRAALKSDPMVTDTVEITILPEETTEPVDKTELAALVEQGRKLKADDYTADAYEAFSRVLQGAKAVLEDASAEEREVQEAVRALTEALEALEGERRATAEEVGKLKSILDELWTLIERHPEEGAAAESIAAEAEELLAAGTENLSSSEAQNMTAQLEEALLKLQEAVEEGNRPGEPEDTPTPTPTDKPEASVTPGGGQKPGSGGGSGSAGGSSSAGSGAQTGDSTPFTAMGLALGLGAAGALALGLCLRRRRN